MEYLLDLLRSLIANEGVVHVTFVALIAAAIFVFGLGVTVVVVGLSSPLRRRLFQLAGGPAPERYSSLDGLAKAVKPFSRYILPSKEWERSRISERLVHAGYRSRDALNLFYATKVLLGILFPAIVLVSARWYPALTTVQVTFFAILACFLGVMLANIVLTRRIEQRMRKLKNGLPDALDLLVVCIESGLGLAPALQRVADELAVSHPELADELALVNAEMRAGVDRVVALKNLAKRTGLDDISGLVAMLSQSMRFGTSIADSLRIYADEFRDRRMQRAEEQAAKIGTKLIFPLALCLFPSFFLVAIGPAVLRAIDAFKHF